jgi:hypothetical protein
MEKTAGIVMPSCRATAIKMIPFVPGGNRSKLISEGTDMISSLLAQVTVYSNGAAGGLLAGGLGLIFVLFAIASFVLWIWALISALSSNMPSTEKLVWVLVIIFLPVLGPILYLVIGRK